MTDEDQIGKRKSDEDRQSSLPAHLRERTDEQRAQDAENQAKWAASVASPFVQGSPADAERARASRLEHDWRDSLVGIRGEMAAATDDAGDAKSPRDSARLEGLNNAYRNASRQLAEALAVQGRFDEAAYYAHEGKAEDLENEYGAIAAAIGKSDEERCGADCDLTFAADPTRLTQDDIVAEVFSPKHNAVVPVMRCNICGDLNARPFTEADRPHLKRREMRKQALELTKGQSPREAAETLRRADLTTQKAFG